MSDWRGISQPSPEESNSSQGQGMVKQSDTQTKELSQLISSLFTSYYFFTLTTRPKAAARMMAPQIAYGPDQIERIFPRFLRPVNEDEAKRRIEADTIRLRNYRNYGRVWTHCYFSYVTVAAAGHLHLVTDQNFRLAHVGYWPGRIKRQARKDMTIRSVRGVLTHVFGHLHSGANLVGPWVYSPKRGKK